MVARRTVIGLLLVLVVSAAGYAIGKQVGDRKTMEQAKDEDCDRVSPCTPSPRRQLIAYYFHRTERGQKCHAIEAYARETLDVRLADRLATNEIVWQPVNMDDAWNQDFVDRYGLTRSSLVLVEVEDGRELGHAVCDRTWELVDDKEAFLDYVESEIQVLLDGWTSEEEAD